MTRNALKGVAVTAAPTFVLAMASASGEDGDAASVYGVRLPPGIATGG